MDICFDIRSSWLVGSISIRFDLVFCEINQFFFSFLWHQLKFEFEFLALGTVALCPFPFWSLFIHVTDTFSGCEMTIITLDSCIKNVLLRIKFV